MCLQIRVGYEVKREWDVEEGTDLANVLIIDGETSGTRNESSNSAE